MSDLPIIPATVVGSHAKPAWWHRCKDLLDSGEWGTSDLEELLTDAVDVAILDQERAGLDIISDGESRRLDGYVDGYYGIIGGIRALPVGRKGGPWGYDQQTRYEAVSDIMAPEGLGIVAEFEYLLSHTDLPTKVTCAGPLTFGSRIRPNNVYDSPVAVAERFAHVINAELKALVQAGATFIQIDEPARGNIGGKEMARLFNMATGGVDAKLAYHICFGNRNGRARFKRQYTDYYPAILEAQADQFVVEFAAREMYEVERFAEWSDGRELGAGVVDVKSFHPETAEDVAERIRKVLEHVPADKLYLNPDCGFGWSPRYMAVSKLDALVAGAKAVRKEISGE
jgi:5-methyltetrahydropteroyltriglutamate--homocysteine methyltransferase